jgi:hypothetical protein
MNTPDSPLARSPLLEPEPLNKAHFMLVRDAVMRRKIIRHSAAVAKFSAVVMLIIGIPALIATIFAPSWQNYLVSAGMCVIGIIEYRGSGRLRRADVKATGILGVNQLALLAIIIIYCAAQMGSLSGQDFKNFVISQDFRSQLSALPDMQKLADSIDHWAPLVINGIFGLVIVLSCFYQGGMAAYYFTRKKHIDKFNRLTPLWVKRLLIETDA